MTTKQAIHLLRRLQDEQFDGQHGDERREALEMAVRALEGDGDTIYRQTAIEFIEYLLSEPCKGHTGDFVEGMRDGYYRVLSVIKYLPSAQPETHDKRTETHECDLIGRQEAIDALKGLPTWWADGGGYYGGAQPPMVALLDPEDAVSAIENLPSAQPERKKGRWINVNEGKWNTYEVLKCSVCGEMDNRMTRADNYCPNCGARMDGESDD